MQAAGDLRHTNAGRISKYLLEAHAMTDTTDDPNRYEGLSVAEIIRRRHVLAKHIADMVRRGLADD